MKNLIKITQCLERCKSKKIYIPKRWNVFDIPFEPSDRREGEIIIDEQMFYITALKEIQQMPKRPVISSLKNGVIYSMLPRTFAAWDKEHENKTEGGTLLDCIALLPLLAKMGINIIYLLPVFEMGQEAKKGELASPYSIKNIMKIDPALHSRLLCSVTPEEEFAAFTEAAHHMGIKVMLDFVFRTCARDNVLINEHPHWFYWIKGDRAKKLCSPGTDDGKFQIVGHENIKQLYGSKSMKSFLDNFTRPPSWEQWTGVMEQYKNSNKTLSEITDKMLGKVVMTGFADTINDPQPPWTDVTYYKYYFEPCSQVKELVDISKYPPFIAQDGVKCSIFPADKPNRELWDYISDVIPFYINRYCLDGARIDMAHALPTELGETIINKIRNNKPDFILWSEEFSPERGDKAKNQGYDFILGDYFSYGGKPNEKALKQAETASLPVTAALETPDTPRIFYTLGKDEKKVRAALEQAFSLPNSIPMINCGQELCELQPMNLGLMNDEKGRFVLSPNNPQYGKLAFFDSYRLNWLYDGDLPEFIAKLIKNKSV